MINIPPIPWELANGVANRLNMALNSNINIFEKLSICYEETDRVLSFLKDYFPCSCGCSYCCKSDVMISQYEAQFIAERTGIKLKNKPFSVFNHTDCPFLKDNKCSVYKYRPFICRTLHVASNPENCKTNGNMTLFYGTELSGYGNKIFESIGQYIKQVNNQMNGCTKDIRSFFD